MFPRMIILHFHILPGNYDHMMFTLICVILVFFKLNEHPIRLRGFESWEIVAFAIDFWQWLHEYNEFLMNRYIPWYQIYTLLVNVAETSVDLWIIN